MNGVLTVNWNRSDPRDGNAEVVKYVFSLDRLSQPRVTLVAEDLVPGPVDNALSYSVGVTAGSTYLASVTPVNAAFTYLTYIQTIPL